MIETSISRYKVSILLLLLCVANFTFIVTHEVYANIEYSYDQAGRLVFATDDAGNAIIYSLISMAMSFP